MNIYPICLIADQHRQHQSKTTHGGHHHHSPKAHQHGLGSLKMAIEADGKQVLMQWRLDADTAYGFEHAPTTPSQKETLQRINEIFFEKSEQLFLITGAGTCQTKATHNLENIFNEGQHHDVDLEYLIECQKPLTGALLNLRIFSLFKQLETLEVQIIGEGIAISQKLKKDQQIKLSK